MMDDKSFETLLGDALDRRGRPAPFGVDVTDRVMLRVAAIGPPRRAEMSTRQFRGWAIAAAAAGIALIAAAAWQAPSVPDAMSQLARSVADGTNAALKLLPTASALAGAANRVAGALAASGRTLVEPLEPFQPLARFVVAALTVIMLSVSTAVVGRDVRRNLADKERA